MQFEDDEEKLQQIRGLGTDIALVNFSLFTFTGSRPIVIFIGMVVINYPVSIKKTRTSTIFWNNFTKKTDQ